MRWRKKLAVMGVVISVGFVVIALASVTPATAGAEAAGGAAASPASSSGSGKSLNVLENDGLFTWSSMDPLTDTSAGADEIYLDAIYGDLFRLSNSDQILPDFATGYRITNGGKTVTITLHPGITFSDGTPFDAQAVAYNFDRDFNPKNACPCLPNFPVTSVTTPSTDTVVLNLSHVYPPIMEAFIGEAPNWIVSPTALQKEGQDRFNLYPVGAGPFVVASDTTNSMLKLTRNPHYWQAGEPKLDSITFTGIGNDNSAYEALQTGEDQIYFGLSTYSLVKLAQKKYYVQENATTSPWGVQLNTKKAPFNNLLAREAVYYATNPKTIDKSIAQNSYPITQSPTGPGGLFYEPKVPGYLTYNLAKAKSLVHRLGGLTVQLETGPLEESVLVDEELKSEWAQAGIKTNLNVVNLEALIQDFEGGNWEAMLQAIGATDPALSLGVAARYGCGQPFSGLCDPTVDQLLAQGASTTDTAARAKDYHEVFGLLAKDASGPMLFATPLFYTASDTSVTGLGAKTENSADVNWGTVNIR